MARAAAAAGTAVGLSSFAANPIEEVVAANPATFFQIYWFGSRERMTQLLGRARDAGAKAIVLTLDWSFAHRRDWGNPAIPQRLDWRTLARPAPQVALRPRWLVGYARAGGPPDLTVPNLAPRGAASPGFFEGLWRVDVDPAAFVVSGMMPI